MGYIRVGRPLPDDVTLLQVVRSMPADTTELDPVRAWGAVATSLVAGALSMYAVHVCPWFLLPLAWAFAGLVLTGWFVVGHEAGHRVFCKNRLLEDVVGTAMFLPLLYPFEPWRIKHNQHHAHTNKLHGDTAWHPVMESEAAGWSKPQRWLLTGILGSPLKCWATIGHWAGLHFDPRRYTATQMPRVVVSWAAVGAFAATALPAIVHATGWTGLVKYWLMPFVASHFCLSVLTLVHHTAPHIPFKPAGEWNAAQAQLSGTVHCIYPRLFDFLCHDISVHVPHHVNPKIPWYNLRRAHASLSKNWGPYLTECTPNWRVMRSIFTELHIYDSVEKYRPFDAQQSRPLWFLELQRRFLPGRT